MLQVYSQVLYDILTLVFGLAFFSNEAVYDGTDAVMLSGETGKLVVATDMKVIFAISHSYLSFHRRLANGPHFEAAVKVMARTCCEAEQSRNHDYLVRRFLLS